jgi:ABC-type molybdate transport system substrate-binding protein
MSSRKIQNNERGRSPNLLFKEFSLALDGTQRRLYLYLLLRPAGPPELAKQFVDFALSKVGQAVVRRLGFITV